MSLSGGSIKRWFGPPRKPERLASVRTSRDAPISICSFRLAEAPEPGRLSG